MNGLKLIFDKAIPADRIAAHYKAGKEGGELPSSAEPPVFSGIKVQGTSVIISWKGDGTLQECSTAVGVYKDVAGAANPYTTPVANGPKFYRLRQ